MRGQDTLINIVARIPVVEAQKPFLVRVGKALPSKGKVSDERLSAAIQTALQQSEH
jgi:hypothetical protein